MYIFLSILVCLASLYYLGNMASTYNYDTTYVAPVVTMFVYSLLTLAREAKRRLEDWDDYGKGDYHYYGSYNGSNVTYHQRSNAFNDAETPKTHATSTNTKGEKVEVFSVETKKEKTYEKELEHYPSNRAIRETLKELEKSRWFRFKKSVCGFLGFDITEKYYKPNYSNKERKIKVTNTYPTHSETNSRYAPNNNTTCHSSLEVEEYNSVAKLMSRSCEIALAMTIENKKD